MSRRFSSVIWLLAVWFAGAEPAARGNVVVSRAADDAATYYRQGNDWSDQEEYDKAITAYTEAIRLDPKHAQAYHKRGLAWINKQEYAKATADYTDAIRLDPQNALTYFDRGNAWDDQHEYDKAIADYTESIRLDPKAADTYYNRGGAWNNKREYARAIADFTEAIRLKPQDPQSFNNRAWIWATCPDPKFRDGAKAVESATTACTLTKWQDAASLDTLAAAHAEAGQFDQAVAMQEKANARYESDDERKQGQERVKLYRDRKPYRED